MTTQDFIIALSCQVDDDMTDVPKRSDAKLDPSEVQWGLVCGWDCTPANVYEAHFHPRIRPFIDRMIVLTDTGFHAKTGDPDNLKICQCGTWNGRMLVETVLSRLTNVWHSKQMHHRVWAYFRARLAWTVAVFNILAQWGMEIDDNDMVRLSIAQFSL